MNFILQLRAAIDFYAAVLSLWWLERRVKLKWEKEKDFYWSDFL